MADKERRQQRAPELTEEQQQEQQQTHQVVQSEPTPAHVLTDRLQGQVGNTLMMGVLSGEDLGGFGALLAGEMFLAAGGVGESILSSNAAVAQAMAATAGDAVMRHAQGGGVLDASMVQSLILRSRGVALPEAVASRFSAAMGHDFSTVRVHTDAAAQEAADRLNAHAFTQGQDIYFGRGTYSPDSRKGQALLGHELTHVVQHDEGRLANPGTGMHVSSPSDSTEQEAYAVEGRIHADLAAADADLAAMEAGDLSPDLAAPDLAAPAAGPESAPSVAGPVLRTEDPDVDSKKGDTKTAGEEFENGSIVRIGDKSGPIGVVVEAPMDVDKGDFGVLLIGEDIPRYVTPEEMEPFSGKLAESFKPSLEAGGLVKVLVDEEWVDGLILTVTEVVEASPLGEVVRIRAEAYPVEDDKVLLDKLAAVATLDPSLCTEPRHAIGEDVYAQVGEDDWKRARVADAWRTEGADITDTALVTEGGSDGFIYLIAFDEEGDVCRSEEYEADQLHEAEQIGGASEEEEAVSEEKEADADGEKAAGEEQAAGDGPAGDAVVPGGEPAPETATESGAGPAISGGGGSAGPAVPPPSTTAPETGSVSLPDLKAPAPSFDKGEKAYIKEQTGLDVDSNLKAVQSSLDEFKSAAADDLQCSVDDIKSTTADSSAIITDASKTYSDASSQLDGAVTSVAASANQGTDAVVSAGKQSVDGAVKTFEGTVQTTTDAAKTALTDKATAMEGKLNLSEAKYARAIDAAIEKESGAMKARFEAVIKKLEAEGKKEEEEGRAIYRQGGAAGAIKRAREAAEKIGIAKVKQTYVKGFQKLLKSTLEKLDAQKGQPSTLLAGKLTAPTIEDVWPATKLHESELKKQQERTRTEADDAKKKFGELTTREGDKQKKATDDVTARTQQTTAAVDKGLKETTANVKAQGDATNKRVNQKLTEQEQEQVDALKAQLAASRSAPDATLWGKYLKEYQADLAADARAIKDKAQGKTKQQADETKKKTDETKTELKAKVDAQNASLQADNQKFADSVTQGIQTTQGNIQSMETGLKDATTKVTTSAQTRQDEATTQLDTEAQAFIDTRVVAGMKPYIKSADEQFGKLSKKMEADLKGAGKKAVSKEDADRDKRSSQCRKAAEHTWGTDEALYMDGLSGLTPAQGYALQVEYEHDWSGEGLQWRIRDETSGSLMKSLLAWTTGDEGEAVKMAMKYAASESLWGPDTEVADKALRGLSDEGRKSLQNDPEFEKSRSRLLQRSQMDWPFTDSHDTDAIRVLSDMSQTKDAAAITADAIQLHDKFAGMGTEENEAFKILEKRDGEGNARLAAAYAKYVYERENQGKKWSDLPEEERKRRASSKLKGDISSEFEYDANEDRGQALLSGDKGSARAAQLKQSSVGLNDTDEALAAMKNDKMFGGDTWIDRVDATQEQANFVAGVNQYKSGGRLDEAYRNKASSAEGQKANSDVKTFEKNKAATSTWLTDEFGEKDKSSTLTGNDDRDVIANNMLHTALDTGKADETDTFAYGVDKLGTEEAKVKQALESIAAIPDTNTRLAKLSSLGSYCAGFISKRAQEPAMQAAQRRAGKAMAKLPGYIQKLEESTNADHKALGGSIRSIMIALDYETDGGEQFDFEMLVVKATVRDDNVSDKWHYAEQKFLSHIGASSLDALRSDPDVIKYQNQSIEDIAKDIDKRRQNKDDSKYGSEGLGGEHKKLVAVQLLRVEKLFNEGKGQWFDAEGWVIKKDGKIPPETQTRLDEFDRQIKKLENAAEDYEADKSSLVNIITTVVSIVAGVLITALTFGAGSVAAAGLIAAAVTLAAGTINIVVKQVVLGDRYGADAFLTDIASMVADAILNVVTMGVGKFKGIGAALENWAGQAAGKMKALRLLISEAAQAIPGEAKNVLFNEKLWDSGKFDQMFQDFFLGMMSSMAGGMTGHGADKVLLGTKSIQESSKKLLSMFANNMTTLLANPNSWNENLGWQVLQTLGTSALGGVLGKGLLKVQAGRINAKTALTEADWQNIANLPADVRAVFFKEISATHRASLKQQAAAGSELHAGLLKDSGITVDPVATEPAKTEPVKADPVAETVNDSKLDKAANDAAQGNTEPVKTPTDPVTDNAVKTDNQSADGSNIDPNKSAADAAKSDSKLDTKAVADGEKKTKPVVKPEPVVKPDTQKPTDTAPEPVKTATPFEADYQQAVKAGYGKGVSPAKQAEMKATYLRQRAAGKKLTAPPNPRWATPRSDAEWRQYHAAAAAGMTDTYGQYKKQVDAGKTFDAAAGSWVDKPAFDPSATQTIDISGMDFSGVDPKKTLSGDADLDKTQPMEIPPDLARTQPMEVPPDLAKTQPIEVAPDLDKTQPMQVPPDLAKTQPLPAVDPAKSQPPSGLKEGEPVLYKGREGYTFGFADGDMVYLSDADGGIRRVPAADVAPGGKVVVPSTKAPQADAPTGKVDNTDTVDTAYTNRSGTQKLTVDPDNDPRLQAAIDQANAKINQGSTPAEKLALLVDHVHNGIKYDQTAQQGMYQKKAGAPMAEAKLGDMLEAGAVVCREKAIFTHQMLAEMGIPSQVQTGNVTVNGPNGPQSYGHAWVVLADGTIVDGTWGKVYPGGTGYPLDRVIKNQTFARPKTSLEPDAIDAAGKSAARTLTDPAALSALNKRAAVTTPDKSPAERLLQPGTSIKLPEKRGGLLGWLGMKKKATVSRVERDMVFVIGADGTEVMVPRADILTANGVEEATAKGLTNADKVDTASHEDDSHRALTDGQDRDPLEFSPDFDGHMAGEPKDAMGKTVLGGGLHTSDGLDALLKANTDLKHETGDADPVSGMPDDFDRSKLPIRSNTLDNGVSQVAMPRESMNSRAWKNALSAADSEGQFSDLLRAAGLDPTSPEVLAAVRKVKNAETGETKVDPSEMPYAGKTLFPADWDADRIRAAALTVQQTGQAFPGKFEGSGIYEGEVDGVRIKVFTMDNKIKSAFPTWVQPAADTGT